ncbi:MAG TPA: signal peptidase II [Trebonia sp.]|nr:signal peptidase II [Trebonia sp.]
MQAAPGAPLSSATGTPGTRGTRGTPGTQATRRRRVWVLLGIAVFVLAADAITKALVVVHLRPGEPVHVLGNVLMLNLLRNSGAAFSVGTGNTIVFTAIAAVVVVYIVRTARNLRSLGWAITLGLLLGGALGNLSDRIFRAPGLFRGDVVDWIELTRYWPVFNVADSAIVCGGILTVLLAMFGYHLDGTRGDRAAVAPAPAAPSDHDAPAPATPPDHDAPPDHDTPPDHDAADADR